MDDLVSGFDKRKPWITKYVIDGKEYGDGQMDLVNDIRIDWFFNQFPQTHTILELGSLEGGHSVSLARHPNVKRVVGIEGRADNYEKACFIQNTLKVSNIEYIHANLETFDLGTLGEFDAVFCVGLLYHLPAPWDLISQMARVSPRLFIWTHYSDGQNGNITVEGLQGIWYQEQGLTDPLSGMSSRSFWPTLDSLTMMLNRSGYGDVKIIEQNPAHQHGPGVTLRAIRSGKAKRFRALRQWFGI